MLLSTHCFFHDRLFLLKTVLNTILWCLRSDLHHWRGDNQCGSAQLHHSGCQLAPHHSGQVNYTVSKAFKHLPAR